MSLPGETRERVHVLVVAHHRVYGYGPTLRWLAQEAGLASVSSVRHHLDGLRAEGLVTWVPKLPRTLAPTVVPPGIRARAAEVAADLRGSR